MSFLAVVALGIAAAGGLIRMVEINELSRRDFLGLALLATAAGRFGGARVDDRPIYRGTTRELIAGVLPSGDWRARYYTLVESVEAPVSEWRVKKLSALAMQHRRPLAEMPDLLRAHRIVRLCEADVSPRAGGPEAPSCFADVFVFADAAACQADWRALEAKAEAGDLDPHPGGLGDEAFVGSEAGRWTMPGKVFFRRANVGVTVFVPSAVPGYEADRFAVALDRRIASTSG